MHTEIEMQVPPYGVGHVVLIGTLQALGRIAIISKN